MIQQTILLVVQVIVSIALIGLVLLQQGKGADAGASFGGGASQTVFGSGGTGNFLTKLTAILATVFFVASLGLAYYARQSAGVGGVDFTPVLEQPKDTDLPSLVPNSPPSEAVSEGDLPSAPAANSTAPVAKSSTAPAAVNSEAVEPSKAPQQTQPE